MECNDTKLALGRARRLIDLSARRVRDRAAAAPARARALAARALERSVRALSQL